LPVVSGRSHSLSPSWAADDVLMQDVPAAGSVLLAVRHTDRVPQLCVVAAGARSFVAVAE
jgi:hypothetical protein